jgi:integrase
VKVVPTLSWQYTAFLINDKSISDITKRQRIAASSSFFTALERWEVINRNPFKGIKGLPKKKISIKQADAIPSNAELDILEAHTLQQIQSAKGKGSTNKRRGNTLALCALKVLRDTNLRVGALQNLIIDNNGYYKAKSKGSIAQGRLDENILNTIKHFGLSAKRPFKSYTANNFSVWLYRTLNSTKMREKIANRFSSHSIRHKFSIDFYNETKDVHALSKRLGHSSLLVTTAYLSGLESGIDE